MVWGSISTYGMGRLHVLEGTMNAERYIKVLEQHMFPKQSLFQQDNAKPHTAAITTARLCSRRVLVLNWSVYSPDVLSYKEHLTSLNENNFKNDHKLFSSCKPISGKNGTKFQHQNSRNSQPRCPDIFNLFWKKRICYTMVNMPPCQQFWDL